MSYSSQLPALQPTSIPLPGDGFNRSDSRSGKRSLRKERPGGDTASVVTVTGPNSGTFIASTDDADDDTGGRYSGSGIAVA
jgi:hypothetical protein